MSHGVENFVGGSYSITAHVDFRVSQVFETRGLTMMNNSTVLPPEQTPFLPIPEVTYGKPGMPFFLGLTAQELYESVNAIPVYLWIHNQDHKVVYHNQLVKEKFGNCLGRDCHTCLMGRHETCSCCKTSEILESRQPYKCHGCRRGGNGQVFDTFHTPLAQYKGSKYVLSLSVVSDNGQKIQNTQYPGNNKEVKEERTFCSMCSGCRKIKESENQWVNVEKYLSDNFNMQVSHGLCRPCAIRLYPKLDL
ncbi:MAG: hypothetical protein KKG47_00790 [Proteobacteria bacterium]|nr:hypothetical protein [Pseudomonadota bacterium]